MAIESLLAAEGILTKVTSLAAQEFCLAWGFKDELTKLNRSLCILQDFLGGAAEQAHHGGKAVKDWVNKLNDIAHDTDDVLDEINYQVLRKQAELQTHMKKKVLNFFSSSNPIVFRQKMAHRIKDINKSLAELKGEAPFIGLVAKKRDPIPQGIRSDRHTNSVIGEKEIIVGRRGVVLDIVKTLTDSTTNEESLSVMAIVGMPGLGKTTVAKSVYNEDSIDKYFQKKIWVCVSNTFEVNSMLSQILESLNPQRVGIKGQDALLKYLKEELKENRYLLVLDDVWNEDSSQWNNLKSCLSNLGVAGSKIIVTTRSAKVAAVVETLPKCMLDIISTDDCWLIIKDKAFPHDVPFPEDFEIMGREIAERCAGIPLVAKVLGSILCSKKRISEWRSIKESRIWNLPDEEDRIMSVLQLSFDNLASPSLKQCFAYCSMFTKDAVMERDNLVQLWMAEGLLLPSPDRIKEVEDGEINLEMEDIGNEYFDVLLQSSLFQDAKTDEYGIVITCKMHDLVHDLAELVSKSERLTGDYQQTDRIVNIQQVSQVSSSMLERIQESNVGRLRSLFSSSELPTNMLPEFRGLRVLNLYEAKIQELPTSIGKLKHLRYLNISRTSIKALPESIGKLYNLQTLRATNCAIEEFPKGVLSLINLRHVYFYKNTKFPIGMGLLTHLQTIPPFYVDEDTGRGIEELGGLNKLKGDLIIYNLEQLRVGDEARKAELKEKKNVKHLKLVWTKRCSAAKNHEDVAEGLQPHHALESLKIDGFMGAKLPSWLMSRSLMFDNLNNVELKQCDNCEELLSLGHLLYLTTLRIEGMENLKCLGEEFYEYDLVHSAATTCGRTRALFPSLKHLSIHYCRKLFQWVELAPTSSERVVVFPCLEELDIKGCHKLRNFPNYFPSLKKLRIDGNEDLTCLPEGIFLNNNNNLISMEIKNCKKLTSIAPNVYGCCASLRELVVYNCAKLVQLPNGLDTLPLLQTLKIELCRSLEMIVITQGMPSLREFRISYCDAVSMLSGLEYCASLQYTNASLKSLSIWHCRSLHSIPHLQSFTSLRHLSIIRCGRISQSLVNGELNIPDSIEELDISDVSTTFPSLNNILASLRTLTISDCEGMLGGLERYARLYILSIHDCPNLTSIEITDGVPFPSLQYLTIEYCHELSSLPGLHHFPSLRTLTVGDCPKLTSISSSISHAQSSSRPKIFTTITRLEELLIHNCGSLQSIPDLCGFTSLRQLKISSCGKIQHCPMGLHTLTHLKKLELGPFWEELDYFPDTMVRASQLENLTITGWPKIKSLPTFATTSLKFFKIENFNRVEALPEWLGNLASLTFLIIWNCQNLKSFPSVKAMKRLTNLRTLFIFGCPLLKERCKEKSGPEWPKISHIPVIFGD